MYYVCDRCKQPPSTTTSRIRNTQSRRIGCLFSVLATKLPNQQGWELKHRPEYKFSTHNHDPSPHPAAHPSHRQLPPQVQDLNRSLYNAGKYLT